MSIFGKSNPDPRPSLSVEVAMSAPEIQSAPKTPTPQRPPEPFHGLDSYDLAVGEIYGVRVWRMDTLGRLLARNTIAKPWRPGVNVAECKRGGYAMGGVIPASFYRSMMLGAYGGGAPQVYSYEEPQRPKVCTQAPTESCTCGFYAYTDPKHEEEALGNAGSELVLGIIRGFGRTLIGTQGFRCEKAEIVALRDPTRGGKKQGAWRQDQLAKLRRVYPNVPLLTSRAELLEFAPIQQQLPDPSTDEFWNLP